MTDQLKTEPMPAPSVAPADANGDGYLTVAEALERAPSDCEERDVEVWGKRLRVRALTAAQAARVKQASINLSGRNPDVAWAEMERMQFQLGVIKPKFAAGEVRELHLKSGAGFAKVIAVIDEISGTDKEELRKAQRDFPDGDE